MKSLSKRNYRELQTLCKQANISASGKKSVLLARLQELKATQGGQDISLPDAPDDRSEREIEQSAWSEEETASATMEEDDLENGAEGGDAEKHSESEHEGEEAVQGSEDEAGAEQDESPGVQERSDENGKANSDDDGQEAEEKDGETEGVDDEDDASSEKAGDEDAEKAADNDEEVDPEGVEEENIDKVVDEEDKDTVDDDETVEDGEEKVDEEDGEEKVDEEDADTNEEKVEDDANEEKVEDANEEKVEDVDEEKVEDDANEEKVEDDANEKVEDDANEEKVEDDANKEKVEDDTNEEKVEDDANKEKVEDDTNEEKVEDDTNEETVEDDTNEEKVEDDTKADGEQDQKSASAEIAGDKETAAKATNAKAAPKNTAKADKAAPKASDVAVGYQPVCFVENADMVHFVKLKEWMEKATKGLRCSASVLHSGAFRFIFDAKVPSKTMQFVRATARQFFKQLGLGDTVHVHTRPRQTEILALQESLRKHGTSSANMMALNNQVHRLGVHLLEPTQKTLSIYKNPAHARSDYKLFAGLLKWLIGVGGRRLPSRIEQNLKNACLLAKCTADDLVLSEMFENLERDTDNADEPKREKKPKPDTRDGEKSKAQQKDEEVQVPGKADRYIEVKLGSSAKVLRVLRKPKTKASPSLSVVRKRSGAAQERPAKQPRRRHVVARLDRSGFANDMCHPSISIVNDKYRPPARGRKRDAREDPRSDKRHKRSSGERRERERSRSRERDRYERADRERERDAELDRLRELKRDAERAQLLAIARKRERERAVLLDYARKRDERERLLSMARKRDEDVRLARGLSSFSDPRPQPRVPAPRSYVHGIAKGSLPPLPSRDPYRELPPARPARASLDRDFRTASMADRDFRSPTDRWSSQSLVSVADPRGGRDIRDAQPLSHTRDSRDSYSRDSRDSYSRDSRKQDLPWRATSSSDSRTRSELRSTLDSRHTLPLPATSRYSGSHVEGRRGSPTLDYSRRSVYDTGLGQAGPDIVRVGSENSRLSY